jgi:hypothetical protein
MNMSMLIAVLRATKCVHDVPLDEQCGHCFEGAHIAGQEVDARGQMRLCALPDGWGRGR